MPIYLISFEKGAMDHIPDGDWGEVGKASHAVVQEAKDAGVYRFAGGLSYDDGDAQKATVATVAVDGTATDGTATGVQHAAVAVDGTIMVTDGPYPEGKELIGGVLIVDVPTRDEALKWAAKTAAACRCAQDVRKFMDDPES